MTNQTKEELKKEFKKRFVTKCSDGELITDFKNGKVLKPSEIFNFFISQFDNIINEKIERIEENNKSYCRCLCEKTKLALEFNKGLSTAITILKE